MKTNLFKRNIIKAILNKKKTDEIIHKEESWHILLKISEFSHTTKSVKELIFKIHTEISKLINASNFYVGLYEAETSTYSFPYYIDKHDDLPSLFALNLTGSLTDYVRKSGKSLLLTPEKNLEFQKMGIIKLVGTFAKSYLAVPLRIDNKIIGVMGLQCYEHENIYTKNDLKLIEFISNHIASHIERKRKEVELNKKQKRLKIAQSVANIGYWEINFDKKTIHISKNFTSVFGISNNKKSISIENFFQFIDAKNKEKLITHFKLALKNNSEINEQIEIKKYNSNNIIVVQIIGQFNDNKSFTYMSGMIQDITKQYNIQKDLKKAKEKAEESDLLKSAFLANMSHEIRTPMNAIIGFSRLLATENLSQKHKIEYSQYIESSSNDLLNLINDIIDVAKIEAGQIKIQKNEFNLHKTLNELEKTYDKYKLSLGKSEITIKQHKGNQTDNDLFIYSDQFRLRQILSNLIGNAIKFTEKGLVEFGYQIKNNNLIFFVRDNGIGIPEDKKDLIFSRFGQVTGSKIKNPGGTGLGLSISKNLVDLLDGKIWVESEIDKGTTFYFSFSNKIISDTKEETKNLKTINKHIKGKYFLIAEDNKINTALILDILKNEDSSLIIDTVENGKEAIEMLKNKDYDLIIMDIRMPVMDGHHATRHIRTAFPLPKRHTPILGLSAHAMTEEADKAKLYGMDDFITKPIVPNELFEKINELTESSYINKNQSKPPIIKLQYKYINLNTLSELYKNDEEKIHHILELCIANIPKQIKQLNQFFSDEKWDDLRTVAHSIKSTFGYLGTEDCKEKSLFIENQSGNTTDYDDIKKSIEFISLNWENAKLEIENILHN